MMKITMAPSTPPPASRYTSAAFQSRLPWIVQITRLSHHRYRVSEEFARDNRRRVPGDIGAFLARKMLRTPARDSVEVKANWRPGWFLNDQTALKEGSDEIMAQRTCSITGKRRATQRADGPRDLAAKSNPLKSAPDRGPAKADHRRSANGLSTRTQRRALLALRARLREDVGHASDAALAGTVEATSASPDTADIASEVIEQDLAVSLLGSASNTLDQIEAALQRMEDGSYGRCSDCGAKIPAARLEAIPYATCCVECATRQERAAARNA